MTQEVRNKLEQWCETKAASIYDSMDRRDDAAMWMKIGAQTVLDNPQEWGLVESSVMETCRKLRLSITEHESENQRLREALEDVDIELSHEGYANSSGEGVDKARTIIKEALKQ